MKTTTWITLIILFTALPIRAAEVPAQLPDPDGKPIAAGLLEVPQHGVYRFRCGFQESSYNAMQVDGEQVYVRKKGGEPVTAEMTLTPGKKYPFKISDFPGEPPRFWLEKMTLLGEHHRHGRAFGPPGLGQWVSRTARP